MNIINDVTTTPTSSGVRFLQRSAVLEGDLLIVDALVVYANGKGNPKDLTVVNPFISGTNVKQGKVSPTTILYDAGSGTLHFEIQTAKDVAVQEYDFTFQYECDGEPGQASLTAIPVPVEYKIKQIGVAFDSGTLTVHYEVEGPESTISISHPAEPAVLTNLVRNGSGLPKVTTSGNAFSLQWETVSADQLGALYLAVGSITINTTPVNYSFALQTPEIAIVNKAVVVEGESLKVTMSLSDSAFGPFTLADSQLTENGVAVEAIQSIPKVAGNEIEFRLVHSVPVDKKIASVISGRVVCAGNNGRSIEYRLDVTDYLQAEFTEEPAVTFELLRHTITNGEQQCFYRVTLNDTEATSPANLDGLVVDPTITGYGPIGIKYTNGNLLITRLVEPGTGTVVVSGAYTCSDYTPVAIVSPFTSAKDIERNEYLPVVAGALDMRPIIYPGGDADIGCSFQTVMANGLPPEELTLVKVISSNAVVADHLSSTLRYMPETGSVDFSMEATHPDLLGPDEKYTLALECEATTPSGKTLVMVNLSYRPIPKAERFALVVDDIAVNDETKDIVIAFKAINVPADNLDNLVVVNHAFDGIVSDVIPSYDPATQIFTLNGKCPTTGSHCLAENIFTFSAMLTIADMTNNKQVTAEIKDYVYAPAGKATPMTSALSKGNVELSWMMRDGAGNIPESIRVGNNWALSENLGNPISGTAYNQKTGVLTQPFINKVGNEDAVYKAAVDFQFPSPDANLYRIDSTFSFTKVPDELIKLEYSKDKVSFSEDGMSVTVEYVTELPAGVEDKDIKVSNFVTRNKTIIDVVGYESVKGRLSVTLSINPSFIDVDFIGNFRFDVTAGKGIGVIDDVVYKAAAQENTVIIGSALYAAGFVRFYGKTNVEPITSLSHIPVSVSDDITNYPSTIHYNEAEKLIEIDYPVKSNEFTGRTYGVEGMLSVNSVQTRYSAFMKVRGMKPQYSNFILTQGGSVLDHESQTLKVNFSLEAFGGCGLGLPTQVELNVVAVAGQFEKDLDVKVKYDELTGKGQLIAVIYNSAVARYPNLDAKVTISSPNVANDFNGTIVGFTGSDNSCEVISARTNIKDEVIFRCGVGYGYGPANRPQMATVVSEFKDVENIEPGYPVSAQYDKDTGVIEIRVKGMTKYTGDIRYAGKCVIGVIDNKGNSSNVTLNINHVLCDDNTSRQLGLKRIGVESLEGKSVHSLMLSYDNYIYPPQFPCFQPGPTVSNISYDKVSGLIKVTVNKGVTHTRATAIIEELVIKDGLAVGHIQPMRLMDSNGPEGINQVGWEWMGDTIRYLFSVRQNGLKPETVVLNNFNNTKEFDSSSAIFEYDTLAGLLTIVIPARKSTVTQAFSAEVECLVNGAPVTALLDSGTIHPDGVTHVVSSGYNKQTGRVEVSWVVYGADGKYPAKINLGTKAKWTKVGNLNTPVPTRESYNPNTGIYYAEFAPAAKLYTPRAFTATGLLETGREDINVNFVVNF